MQFCTKESDIVLLGHRTHFAQLSQCQSVLSHSFFHISQTGGLMFHSPVQWIVLVSTSMSSEITRDFPLDPALAAWNVCHHQLLLPLFPCRRFFDLDHRLLQVLPNEIGATEVKLKACSAGQRNCSVTVQHFEAQRLTLLAITFWAEFKVMFLNSLGPSYFKITPPFISLEAQMLR